MKLIKILETRRADNRKMKRWGLFLCSYCLKEVKKRKDLGLKYRSCGCARNKLIRENHTIHGCTCKGQKTRLYEIWKHIKQRCYNINQIQYKDYGGRGIKVCNEWKNDYLTFKTWALNNGYKNNLTIDRKDNNGNYEPSNCKWSTRKEQAHNRRNTKLSMKKANQIRSLYFSIKITKTLLGKIFSVSYQCISDIVNNKSWIN